MKLILPVVPIGSPGGYIGAVCRDICRRGEKPLTERPLRREDAGAVVIAFYVDHGLEADGKGVGQARALAALGFHVEARALNKGKLTGPDAVAILAAAVKPS